MTRKSEEMEERGSGGVIGYRRRGECVIGPVWGLFKINMKERKQVNR
jgi:hypothetical protein